MSKDPLPASFHTISDAELTLLKVIWDHGPATPAELRQSLEDQGEARAYTTVQTLLHRMLRKGYVVRSRAMSTEVPGAKGATGHAHVYEACLDREDLLLEHMRDLAQRVCDGHTGPLMLSLAKTRKLSEGDLSHLRRIIDAPRRRKRGR